MRQVNKKKGKQAVSEEKNTKHGGGANHKNLL